MKTKMTDARTRALSHGNQIPILGLGLWQVPDGRATVDAVRWALEAGYRHIDTAQMYGNEASVGRALRESGVPREEVFITTKFYPARRDPVAELERSLRRLGVEYVDLYLIHWPQRGPTWAWPAMQRTRELGYARSIGVSNFAVAELDEMLAACAIPPVVNQVEFSPFAYRRALLEACRKRGIVVEAFSPLGTGQHLSDATVQRVAEDTNRTPAQSAATIQLRGVARLLDSTDGGGIEVFRSFLTSPAYAFCWHILYRPLTAVGRTLGRAPFV